MVKLNPTTYKNGKRLKQFVSLSLFIIVILPAMLFVNSPLGAELNVRDMGGPTGMSFASLQDAGGFESEKELAKGKFLVASRRLKGPNFQQTVVLLIRYGQDGTMGLVINRPSQMKLSTVLPDIKELAQRKETLYVGGPVEVHRMLLLIRSAKPPEASVQVIKDVYISSSRKVLQRLIKNAAKDERFRIYAGYAGWAPKQLEFEVSRGDWHVLKADAETLFGKKSSEIWQELIDRISVKWVRATKTPDHPN